MSIINDIKVKYEEWSKKTYMYCPICNAKKIKIKDRACVYCKNNLLNDVILQQKNYERIFNDINKGYKKLEPYLSRYQILLEIMERVYNEVQYIPEKVQLEPSNFAEFKQDLLENNLNKVIKNMKVILVHRYNETGELSTIRDIKKLRNEILDMQIKYPQFKEYLTTKELQKVIDEVNI